MSATRPGSRIDHDALVASARQHLMRTYPDTDLAFESGHGSWLVASGMDAAH